MENTQETTRLISLTVDEMEKIYDSMLATTPLARADKLYAEYNQAIQNLRGEPLGGDAIRYYMANFNSVAFDIARHLSRQGLRSDVVSIYSAKAKSGALLDTRTLDGKFIREEKEALSNINTEAEQQLEAIYKRTVQALELSNRAINNTCQMLNMMASMHMSDRKLGASI